MISYIENLMQVNQLANKEIGLIEKVVSEVEIKNEKDKANFGNLCLILRSFRIISDATEAMLMNDNVLMDDEGNYYQKIIPGRKENKDNKPEHTDEHKEE